MIAKLTGIVDSFTPEGVIVDVGGVGYWVMASGRTISYLSSRRQQKVSLFIETSMRQEQIHLYGFKTEEERCWFRMLLAVQGVGAKMAFSLLTAFSEAELLESIATQNRAAITRAEGVGPKLAGRIVAELKDKVAKHFTYPLGVDGTMQGSMSALTTSVHQAISALVHLGYRQQEATEAVARVKQKDHTIESVETLIRLSLSSLSSSLGPEQ